MAGWAGPIPSELIEQMMSLPQPPCTPIGHPERAVPHVPPSPVELELWADLMGHDLL